MARGAAMFHATRVHDDGGGNRPAGPKAAAATLRAVDPGAEAANAADVPERSHAGRADALIGLIRIVVAASGFFIFALDRAHAGPHELALVFSVLFLGYAALLYMAPPKLLELLPSRSLHWADAAWVTLLVWPSGGLDSAFYPAYFFPILAASIESGFADGLAVTLAAGVVSSLLHLITLGTGNTGAFRPTTLTHSASLMMAGYLLARWSSSEAGEKRRLAMLGDISRMPNPRVGPQQVMGSILERIRDFFDADCCLALMPTHDSGHVSFLADRHKVGEPLLGKPVDESLAGPLVALADQAVLFNDAKAQCATLPERSGTHCGAHALKASACADEPILEQLRTASGILDARHFISLPLRNHANDLGRLYVARRSTPLRWDDLEFLAELAEQIAPLIENIHVLDRIASDATLHERQKISRDLHDSTIQPYIGLKLGLEALRRQVGDEREVARELDDLIRMTAEGIEELRRYVGGLRKHSLNRETSLVHAIWRVAEKYRDYYGIEIAVNANPELYLSDRLAAEVFQIVNEGLSNIRRHTASRTGTLNLRRQANELVVQIINHGDTPGNDGAPFQPRSITERVRHLGGHVDIATGPEGTTIVTAEIPL